MWKNELPLPYEDLPTKDPPVSFETAEDEVTETKGAGTGASQAAM